MPLARQHRLDHGPDPGFIVDHQYARHHVALRSGRLQMFAACGCPRQIDGKARTLSGLALDVEMAAKLGHHAARGVKAEPDAGARLLGGEERLEPPPPDYGDGSPAPG